MASVVQAFDRFLRSLEVTEAEHAEIARRQRLIVERLTKGLGGVRQGFLGGAHARGTAIRPLDDVDVFIVLDPAVHRRARDQGPAACLEALRRALLSEGPLSKESIEIAGRAARVVVRGVEIVLALIPAFEESPGVYVIPDREGQGFIRTNPSALQRATARANDRAGSKLLPVLRAAKHWSRRNGSPISGLHLEALAPKALSAPPLAYPQAFRQFFVKLVEVALRSCIDPGGVGPNLEAWMNAEQQSRLKIMLQEATKQADLALQYEATWRPEEAHGVWRSLFGTAYPEAGKR